MYRPMRMILAAAIPLVPADKDDAVEITNTEAAIQKRLELLEALAPLSGWERVKFMFSRDEYGDLSPHVSNIIHITLGSFVAGAVYGGYKKSQVAYLDFMRTNQASKFDSHREAKKLLQDKYTLAFGKGAFQLGWRSGLFSFMFMTVTNAISAYRNNDGILEYTCGGAAAGISYRLHLGMRGVIVGGILGATLGTAGGVISIVLARLSGFSLTDIRNSQYIYTANRRRMEQIQMDYAHRRTFLSENMEVIKKLEEDEEAGRIYDKLDAIEKIQK